MTEGNQIATRQFDGDFGVNGPLGQALDGTGQLAGGAEFQGGLPASTMTQGA